MKKIEKSEKIAGKEIKLTTGHIAHQATSAVMAQTGETVVMATVVAAPLREDLGYFPLMVEYRERLSAGGRIKGSRWVKRAGRPTDDETLTARLIDRSIRPLFPSTYKKEVQIIVQVMAIDGENSPDVVGAIAVSAALSASEIPWMGPIGVSRVSLVEGKEVVNPTEEEKKASDLDLVVSSTSQAIVMVESGSKEVKEKQIVAGLSVAFETNKKVASFIEKFAKEVGKKKETVETPEEDKDLKAKVKKLAGGKIEETIQKLLDLSNGRNPAFEELKAEVVEAVGEEDAEASGMILDKMKKAFIREAALSGKRIDGRKTDELRKLSAEVGFLPRVHGSGLFSRGETQALTVATLGPTSLNQLIETADGEESKRYIHHYSFPPYSVGETGKLFTNRREIGHGALAEKALFPVIPSEEDFPYAIHVTTEILSSNGSTSMASTCGSTLSLMDAGVPIKSPVAGIAMGLIIEDEKNIAVLTDIMGIEDANGDMDFKVAGTKDGVTALQLDVKTPNLTVAILEKALKQAKKARLEILAVMQKAIKTPRKSVSANAPKIKTINIPKEKIGELIGPGGKNIKKLMADNEVQIDVNDEGVVSVSGVIEAGVTTTLEWIDGMTQEVEIGKIYDGKVVRLEDFGAFVQILPGKDGLVHISELADGFVKSVSDVVSEGDEVKVKVLDVDRVGKVALTMKLDSEPGPRRRGGSGGGRGGDRGRGPRDFGGRGRDDRRGSRGPRRDDRRGPRDGRSQRDGGPRTSGPNFPMSRLVDLDRKK